jgi:hypothetical protein
MKQWATMPSVGGNGTGEAIGFAMRTNYVWAVLLAVLVWACGGTAARAAEPEGVALAIVYDTSGSMKDLVRDASGKRAPKYKIANRALEHIARQIEAYTAKAPAGSARRLDAALFTFDGAGTREVVKFGPFDAQALITWARNFHSPGRGTPLGAALETAAHTVLKSNLPRKHVLVLTDGENTVGADPAEVLPGLNEQAARKHAAFSVHFVAFDVDARVFAPLKKLGATVLGAADEPQLNAGLAHILQHQILLEDEEPKKN